MPRELTSHKVNGCNDALVVNCLDEPGSGGACHSYLIGLAPCPEWIHGKAFTTINFQNGPIREVGTNGVTHETLLSVLMDRLEGFQSGQYATIENQIALDHLRAAQAVLKFRTEQRSRRGVEGTHAV